MNYIKHLTGFFDRIIQDHDLNPTHISLYIALFQFWNLNRFQNPISITRDEVMRISKICSKATYHKCMRELSAKEYIDYEPSFNPFRGSLVFLYNFSEDLKPVQKRVGKTKKSTPIAEQVVNKQQTASKTSSGTSSEQALVSSINNINITNIENGSNLEELPPILNAEVIIFKDNSPIKKSNPVFKQVQSYFLEQHFPEIEAQKFFNHFTSNGWRVGGKTPMVVWTAAAQNWMLNANKFEPKSSTPKANHLNIPNFKNYGEPL